MYADIFVCVYMYISLYIYINTQQLESNNI